MIKIKTKWNLNLFYKSEKDPQIRKDIEKFKNIASIFEKKYSNTENYLKNEDKLLQTLKDYEKLLLTDGGKPFLYFYYRRDLDGKDKQAQANLNKLTEELAEYENKILFFILKLGKIDRKTQSKFLKSKKLLKYNYFLKKIFETSKYDLTESEEKILNLKNLPSYDMWVNGVEKSISKQIIEFKNKQMSIGEAQYQIPNLNYKERRILYGKIIDKLKTISDFAESEMNAIVIDKKISDKLRGFDSPYSATILGYENKEKSVLNLIDIVTKHFYISNRFYKLKKKLLKLKTFEYCDRGAKIGNIKKKISFKDAYETLHFVFKNIDPEYARILDKMLSNGQIDVYPKLGKSGGAYCSSHTNTPTLVLLNQTDDFKSLLTFAHEMGHAIHSEMSKSQPIIYESYTTPVAETASTFFEQIVFDAMFDSLNKKEKITVLHDKIQNDIETIFRQVSAFNFEKELHSNIREKGFLSANEIGALHNKHMKKYLGSVVKMKDIDGLNFITWSHFRRFFYVYSYSYGKIISKVLSDNLKKDKNFAKNIRKFLLSGRSKNPDDIFKDVGIDMSKRDFFKNPLLNIEKDIENLEKML